MPEPYGSPDPNNPVSPPVGVKPPEPPKPEGVKPGAAPEQQPSTVPYGALHEEREKRKALDIKLEQIKLLYGDKIKFDPMGNILPPEPIQPVTPTTGIQAISDLQRRVDETWEKDPKEAVRMEIGLAISWYDQQSALVDLQRDAARFKFPDFSKWESEINSYLRRLPLQQRTQPGIIELAYKYVKGDKIEQILETERAELARKYAAGEIVQGLPPGAGSGLPPGQGPTLTEDEMKVANAMNIPPNEYLKYKSPQRGI